MRYLCTMIYPKNFEAKIGFNEVRELLRQRCLSPLGRDMVDVMGPSDDAEAINEWMEQLREFRCIQAGAEQLPLQYFFDVRPAVARLRMEGTHIDEGELFDLRRSLDTICGIVNYLNRSDSEDDERQTYPYPALHRLTEGVETFPQLVRRIDQILDKFGRIKDSASPELMNIRRELARTEGGISKTLYSILRSAQSEGLVEKDVTPAVRDGRLVIPVTQGLKRRIRGIVHDESASGKTVFIEPAEVVEANNRIRELESDERREIIRILTELAKEIRPHVKPILYSYTFLAKIDLVRAKAELARLIKGIEPDVKPYPHIDWIQAVHPLLRLSLEKQGKSVVPLDVTLTQDKRILIISGPNAGGKSVCLKTVGLVQYMLQCGLSVPIGERSQTGMFGNIFHSAAQKIYERLSASGGVITQNMLQALRKSNSGIEQAVDEAFNDELFKSSVRKAEYNGLQLINREVIAMYLRRLIDLDIEQAPFSIIGLEADVAERFEVNAGANGFTTMIGGRVDRIDLVGGNEGKRLRVVDYKTGGRKIKPLGDLEAVFDPAMLKEHSDYYLQAMLYSMIVGRKADLNKGKWPTSPALLFIQHTAGDSYDPTLMFGKMPIIDAEEYRTAFTERLKEKVDEMFNPEIPFVPTSDENICKTCPYSRICGA